jgi:hypothetical protein
MSRFFLLSIKFFIKTPFLAFSVIFLRAGSRRSKQINVTEFEMMAKLSPSERRVVWKKRLAEKAAEDAARAAARAAATESR